MSTSVPTLKFTPTGIYVPAESSILNGVLTDFDHAMGGNLNKNLETPQGQLSSSWTAIIADKNSKMQELFDGIDPDYSSGVFQDAIGKIYFMERSAATSSIVECQIMGLAGTVVPQGFLIKDQSNHIWRLDSAVTVSSNGVVTGQFSCVTLGVVQAAANTVNVVYQSIIGIDRVNNLYAAAPGQDVENPQDFEYRRKNSVALNSVGMPQSVRAALFSIEGVQDVFVHHNVKDNGIYYGHTNYALQPHSLYVAIIGGSDKEIAQKILDKSGIGCNYNGNTTVTVYDTTYSQPQPQYEISFNRPDIIQIYFRVKIEDNSSFSNDDVPTLKSAITNAFYGLDGGVRERIAGHIHIGKYIKAILSVLPNIHLIDLEVGFSAGEYTDYLLLGIDQFPSIDATNIDVQTVEVGA